MSFFCNQTYPLSGSAIISLLGKENFNLDKMLHRGKYQEEETKRNLPPTGLKALIGVTSEFSIADKLIYFSTMTWTVGLVVIFVCGCIYNTFQESSTSSWVTFWKYYLLIVFTISLVSTIWFLIGGLCDVKKLFNLLAKAEKNIKDNGTITKPDSLTSENEREEIA